MSATARRSTLLSLLGAAVLGAVATATPASAHATTSRSITVHSADLDLTSDAGTTTLDRRIRGAANRVCGMSGAFMLREKMDAAACRTAAIAGASAQVQLAVAAARQGRDYAANVTVKTGR